VESHKKVGIIKYFDWGVRYTETNLRINPEQTQAFELLPNKGEVHLSITVQRLHCKPTPRAHDSEKSTTPHHLPRLSLASACTSACASSSPSSGSQASSTVPSCSGALEQGISSLGRVSAALKATLLLRLRGLGTCSRRSVVSTGRGSLRIN
jgi:hypothetical protein